MSSRCYVGDPSEVSTCWKTMERRRNPAQVQVGTKGKEGGWKAGAIPNQKFRQPVFVDVFRRTPLPPRPARVGNPPCHFPLTSAWPPISSSYHSLTRISPLPVNIQITPQTCVGLCCQDSVNPSREKKEKGKREKISPSFKPPSQGPPTPNTKHSQDDSKLSASINCWVANLDLCSLEYNWPFF